MKIYKIVNDENDLVYFGSTKQKLCKRMGVHRAMLKRYEEGKTNNFCSSYEVMQYENPQIILVEETDCQTREQLRARERYYIESCDCVNKRIPGRTSKQWEKDNPESLQKRQERFYAKTDKKEYQKECNRRHREKKKKMKNDSQEKINEKNENNSSKSFHYVNYIDGQHETE